MAREEADIYVGRKPGSEVVTEAFHGKRGGQQAKY